MPNGRKDSLTDAEQQKFLAIVRQTLNVSAAARALGRPRDWFYRYRDREPEFALSWANAVEEGKDDLVASAVYRGKDGVPKPVYYRDEQIDTVIEYDTKALELALRAHRPELFTQRSELSGPNGGPIKYKEITVEALSAKLLRLADRLNATEEDEDA